MFLYLNLCQKTLTECRIPEDPNLLMTTVFAIQCAILQKILSVLEILKRCLYLGSLIKLTTGMSETQILIYKTYYMRPFHLSCCIGREDSVKPTGAKSRICLANDDVASFPVPPVDSHVVWCTEKPKMTGGSDNF